jgi:hypothetical protein
MSVPKGELPEIVEYPQPQVETASYQFSVRGGFVRPEGGFYHANKDLVVSEPTVESALIAIEEVGGIEPTTTQLRWLQFYQRAVAQVRHPERFDDDTPGSSSWYSEGKPVQVEKVYGEIFPAARTQLVTEADETGLKFASVEEILDEGAVTPFMTSWLESYSVKTNDRGFNRFLIPLLPLLDHKLAADIRDNKFHDFDFNE